MDNLSPIILFVYNRPDHTKKTLQALQKNYLAENSPLFIFSDAPKSEKQEEQVTLVRDLISNICGFKTITIIKTETNKGLANSIIDGVTKIINKFGRAIVLEDDLISSKYFIQFMNKALDMYEKDNRIWSISGYTPNINIPASYKNSAYLTVRGCSWGWATWKDRWNTIDWKIKDYNEFKHNIQEKKEFNIGGNDLSLMLDDQMHGRINSWAIRWVYNEYKLKKYTVYPAKSYIKNIGMDFSGTHSSNNNKYNTEMLDDNNVILRNDLGIDKNIQNEFKKFYDLNFKGYMGVLTRKAGIYNAINNIRKRLQA